VSPRRLQAVPLRRARRRHGRKDKEGDEEEEEDEEGTHGELLAVGNIAISSLLVSGLRRRWMKRRVWEREEGKDKGENATADYTRRIRRWKKTERKETEGSGHNTLFSHCCFFTATKALFSSPKKQKVFKIFRHIESYGTCMKH